VSASVQWEDGRTKARPYDVSLFIFATQQLLAFSVRKELYLLAWQN
jgi:hypothetical protein